MKHPERSAAALPSRSPGAERTAAPAASESAFGCMRPAEPAQLVGTGGGGRSQAVEPQRGGRDSIHDSPKMVAQRQLLGSLFGAGRAQAGAEPGARPAAFTAPHANAPIQAALLRGRNTGWGLTGWADEFAKERWAFLDKAFNTELGPKTLALKDLLKKYLANPPAPTSLQSAVDELEAIHGDWDTKSIQYSDAPGLIQRLKDAFHQADTAKDDEDRSWKARIQERNDTINGFLDRIGDPLTTLRIMTPKHSPDYMTRRTLKSDLELSKASQRLLTAKESEAFETRVAAVETDFDRKHELSLDEWAELAKLKNQPSGGSTVDADEAKRQQTESRRLRSQLGSSYVSLLANCAGDIDRLAKLVATVGLSDVGRLANAMRFVSADEWDQLRSVHDSAPEYLNRILIAVGKRRAANVLTLLQRIGKGQEAKLASLLEATKGDADNHLAPLLAQLDIDKVAELAAQCDNDSARLGKALTTGGVLMAEVKVLLATDSRADTVFLVEQVPDTAFLLKLQPIINDAAALRLLVADLGRNAQSKTDMASRLKAPPPATKDDLLNLTNVQTARGLRTNAGVRIASCQLSDLSGPGERSGLSATLAHIRGGKQPALTHSGGAKFGDPFDNNAGRLPGVPGAGGYKEYYVEKDPTSTSYHGDRRLVVSDATQHIYYTADHYLSFSRLMV